MLNQSINRPLVLRYMPRREVLYLTCTWTDRPTDRPATGSFFFLSFFFLSYFRVGAKLARHARGLMKGGCERMRVRVRVRVSLGGVGEKASSWVSGYR